MDTMKKVAMWVIFIILFYMFSNFLIFIGLNSNYDKIQPRGELPSQIQISRAEATLVNGRINGTIQNNDANNLNGKYLKIDLYTSRDILVGTKYLQISNLEVNAQEKFSTYFKAQDVESYDISIVNEVPQNTNGDLEVFISEDMKFYAIIGTLILLIII